MKRFALLLIALLLSIVPSSAVIAEIAYIGKVEDVTPTAETMVVNASGRLGLAFDQGAASLVVDPVRPVVLNGTVPGGAAGVAFFQTGTYSAVTVLGCDDGPWIAAGTLKQTPQGDLVITGLAGDPAAIPVPFVGNYTISLEEEPDCANATGTIAPAIAANVTLFADGREVYTERLLPGQNFTWNGRNDGSAVAVTFLSGEAPAQSCPGKAGMTGPQPISICIVNVTPPIGLMLSDPVLPVETPTVPADTTPASPQSAGLMPLTALIGLFAAAIILMRR